MKKIAHPIPADTRPATLRRLLAKYSDPATPVPTRYRVTMLGRIATLLIAAAHTREGER